MSGESGAPTIVRSYHHDAEVLLGFLASHHDAPEQRVTLLPKTFLEVLRVCLYEEFFLHPVLRAAGMGDERPAGELLTRLREIEQTLKLVERLGPDDARFDPAVDQLVRQFREHGRRTEAALSLLQERRRAEELDDDLGDRLTATTMAGPTHVHPHDRIAGDRTWPRPGLTDELREALVIEIRSHEPEAGPSLR
jgi:hypothetical protein